MNYLLPLLAASVMLVAISCGDKKTADTQAASLETIKVEEMPQQHIADTGIIPTGHPVTQRETNNAPGTNIDWDKKIIKTGTLNIEVDNYEKFNAAIHQHLKKWGAYVAGETENSSDYKIENSMVIKIPVQYFDEAVQELSTQSGKLLVKKINAHDVTGEFQDTRARMEAKKRIRMRYLEMTQKAKNMEEVLQIEKEINAIQELIEAGEGRINYLGHAAAYSTIEISFFQVLNPGAMDSAPGFGKRMLIAMSDGLSWMSEILIALITIWPLWLAVIALILFFRRRARLNKVISAGSR